MFDRELFDRQQEERRLWFARKCWVDRHKMAPSGITWGEVFAKKEGMTLDEFKLKQEEKNGSN